jgi:hypothetical protein
VRWVHETIANSQALTSRFARWPSFHDADVLRVRLDRRTREPPSLEAEIHLWEGTPEVDARGSYVL